MQILRYPVEVLEESDGVTITFPDMPYGVSCGESKEEALVNATDCLEEIIASLIKEKKDIPMPSPMKNQTTIILSPTFSAKVLLYVALRDQHLTKAELARRLNWEYPQVDRLFDVHHNSTLSQLVQAAAVLGKTFVVGMEDSSPR